jgi:hypothetical protein
VSKFLEEIHSEIKIRLEGYQRERETLSKATSRISELDALIAEAESELRGISSRIPHEEKDE